MPGWVCLALALLLPPPIPGQLIGPSSSGTPWSTFPPIAVVRQARLGDNSPVL